MVILRALPTRDETGVKGVGIIYRQSAAARSDLNIACNRTYVYDYLCVYKVNAVCAVQWRGNGAAIARQWRGNTAEYSINKSWNCCGCRLRMLSAGTAVSTRLAHSQLSIKYIYT